MRALRRSLSVAEQNKAAHQLCKQISAFTLLRRGKRVALYLANDGEIDPTPLIKSLRKRGIHCYLPVLHPFTQNQLLFCEYHEGAKLVPNRYGILEPNLRTSRRIPATYLNLVFLPLVAFDNAGNRMGMGGGYYDRTFAFKRFQNKQAPHLIGLAHECQRVAALPVESWDIPLSAIMTDQKTDFFA